MALTWFILPIIFIFPPLVYIILAMNTYNLNSERFTGKYGVLYDGLKLYSDRDREVVKYVMPWFLFRRFLLSILIL
jgi:hypothetical protein